MSANMARKLASERSLPLRGPAPDRLAAFAHPTEDR
jgi:hypothetical protein